MVEIHLIEAALFDHRHGITSAAHKVLRKWFVQKEDKYVAWKELAQALVECELNSLIDEILKK